MIVGGNPIELMEKMGGSASKTLVKFFEMAYNFFGLGKEAFIQIDIRSQRSGTGDLESKIAIRMEPSTKSGLVMGFSASFGRNRFLCANLGGTAFCELGCSVGGCPNAMHCLFGTACVQCRNNEDCGADDSRKVCHSMNQWSWINSKCLLQGLQMLRAG